MDDFPADMAGLIRMFRTEEVCLSYLVRLRWPDGYVCERCGGRNHWKKTRGRFTCCGCLYESSVTAGTLFQDTRKPLRLWFQAIWYVVSQKNGVSALGLQKAIGLGSYHTAWEWLHTFRFNRRASRSRGKLFYRLVEQALNIDPVPAKTLKHKI
jgi:transposase-like protein